MEQHDQADPQGGDDAVERALTNLREAVAEKRVEPICAAYRVFREAVQPDDDEDPFQLIDPEIAEEIRPFIVSAFSHRRCFMCDNGVVHCQQCATAGELMDGKTCPLCKGFGHVACGFCRGTGWAVRELLPHELAGPVLEKQLVHIHEELTSLLETIGTGKSDELRELPRDQKRTVAAWLIRVYARLRDLIQHDAIPDEQERARLAGIASRIRKCFLLIR